jgi:hypothetical protein
VDPKILDEWSAIRTLSRTYAATGSTLPCRVQRGAVSGARKQTIYACVFWINRKLKALHSPMGKQQLAKFEMEMEDVTSHL